jgi:hypothetical protein
MAEEPLEPVGPPPEESQNRVFVLLALALGGLFIVGLILIALFAFVIGPNQRRTRSAAATGTAAGNLAAAQALTATQLAQLGAVELTPVGTATAVSAAVTNTPLIPPSATNTRPPTNTAPPTNTFTPGPSPTAAVAGQGTNTPQALRTRTPTPSLVGTARSATPTRVASLTPTRRATATALPTTGFADDVGIPGLLALGAGLAAVLFIARRLRLGRA